MNKAPEIFTIGHSTHPLAEFIVMLESFGIGVLVDVRTVPRSRHNPQFNADTLPQELKRAGIEYVHMKGLGGLRRPLRGSANTAWRSAGFRGFADYMQTEDFSENLAGLITLASAKRVAIMCAEALPWRCHRSLIADALTALGIRVFHITGKAKSHLHRLTPFATVHGRQVTYPGRD